MLGLPAFFGLFTGAVVMVYAALGAVGIARPLALASLWTAAEFVRGHLLTGFPWNLIGSAWSDAGPLLQAASVVGIYGLSWLTVAWAALPAVLAAPGAPGWRPASGATAALGLGAALLVAVAAAGGARLAIAPDPASPQASQPDIRLRLVQPNIEQSLKWRDSERAQIFRTLLGLSEAPAPAGPPTAIIWPEAATAVSVRAVARGAGGRGRRPAGRRPADHRHAARHAAAGRRHPVLERPGRARPRRPGARHLRQIPSGAVRRVMCR